MGLKHKFKPLKSRIVLTTQAARMQLILLRHAEMSLVIYSCTVCDAIMNNHFFVCFTELRIL